MKEEREGGRPTETEAALLIAMDSFQEAMESLAEPMREVAAGMRKMKNAVEQMGDYVGEVMERIMDSLKVDCPVCGERVIDVSEHASGMPDQEHGVLEIMET